MLSETELTADIENSMNSPDRRELRRLLSKLRLHIALRRCVTSVTAPLVTRPPFVDLEDDHPLSALGKHKLFIRVPKDSRHLLVSYPSAVSRVHTMLLYV